LKSQFEFNCRDGTLYSQNNSFFQSESNVNKSIDLFDIKRVELVVEWIKRCLFFIEWLIFSSIIRKLLSTIDSYNTCITNNSNFKQIFVSINNFDVEVQWLVENFEPAEGCSLRRSTLYSFYISHCSEQKLEAVNPASFGKLIRSVFLGLRTRRLGTRGNSKYHYYGIRLKQNSNLNIYSDEHGELHFKSIQHLKNHRWTNSNDEQISTENKPILLPIIKNQFSINENLIVDSNHLNIQLIKQFEISYKDHCHVKSI
jgi:hypothetical protein